MILFKYLRGKHLKEDRKGALVERAYSRIKADLFPVQSAIVDDPSRKISVMCARRVGKTHWALAELVLTMLSKDRARTVIGMRRLKKVKEQYWYAIQEFLLRYGIPFQYHIVEMKITLDWNDSQVFLVGADSESDMDIQRGSSNDLVILDECGVFSATPLEYYLSQVLEPSLMDRKGRLCIIGTPGKRKAGPFYLATSRDTEKTTDGGYVYCKPHDRDDIKKFVWSFHTWTQKENLAIPHLWDEALRIKEENGWSDDNRIWLEEFLAIWCGEDSDLVYKYAAVRERPELYWEPILSSHQPFGLPDGHFWRFGLALDVGADDKSVFTIAAWSATSPYLFYCLSESHPGKTISQLVEVYKTRYEPMVPFSVKVCDAPKVVTEDLVYKYGVFFKLPDKQQKMGAIDLFNSDMLDSKIRFRRTMIGLFGEMEELDFDLGTRTLVEAERKDNRKENPKRPNDHCDTVLYLHREARMERKRWQVDNASECDTNKDDVRAKYLHLDRKPRQRKGIRHYRRQRR